MFSPKKRLAPALRFSTVGSFPPSKAEGLISKLLPPTRRGTLVCLPLANVSTGCSTKKYPSILKIGTDFLPARFINSSAGMARKSFNSSHPIFLASSTPFCSPSSNVGIPSNSNTEPLDPIAWANKPWQSGEAIKEQTDIEPADSPTMVMRFGSPPKAAIFSFTHWIAATWSNKP